MNKLRQAFEQFFQRRADETEQEPERSWERTSREIKASIFALLALFELVALTSYVPIDSHNLLNNSLDHINNLGGIVGAIFSQWFLESVGITGYSILALTTYLAYASLRGYPLGNNLLKVLGATLATLLAAMASYLAFSGSVPELSPLLGGYVGKQWGAWLARYFNTTGAFLLVSGGFLITAIITTELSLTRLLRPLLGENTEDDLEEPDQEIDEPPPRPKARRAARTLTPKKSKTKRKKKSKNAKKKKSKKEKDDDETIADEEGLDPELMDEELDEATDELDTDDELTGDEGISDEGEFQDLVPVKGKYTVPSLRSLHHHHGGRKKPSRRELKKNARKLCEHLMSFNVTGEVETICVGPIVTTYEYKPSAGIKLRAIANVQKDLGIVLGTPDLRIVAPIPGKTVVGIEVPRTHPEIIALKEIVSSKTFDDKELKLPVALGKATDGRELIGDLTAMPHLLVAGATGSGKSVFINSLIMGFLYRLTPQQLRLILIDPKMLELNAFDGIPHLVSNVITNNNAASNAFSWAVIEMENRYDLMAEVGAKNIESYNAKMKSPSNKLPYIVIVVDELADLMMSCEEEIEPNITRLAQKARAAGIHLVIATQRPSTDVITGLIKANIPSRLSFKVPSGIDSRTILDTSGAEDLIGRGDSLMIRPAQPLQRIHGCFVSEEELGKVVRAISRKNGSTSSLVDFSKKSVE